MLPVKFLEQCVDMLVLFYCVYEDVCDALQGHFKSVLFIWNSTHRWSSILSLALSASLEAPQTGTVSTNTWWHRQSFSLPQRVLRVSVSEIVPGGIHKGVHGVCFSLRRPFTPDINRRKSVSQETLPFVPPWIRITRILNLVIFDIFKGDVHITAKIFFLT